MIINQPLGNLQTDEQFQHKTIDYVDMEWHDARRRVQKVHSRGGMSLGLRLDQQVMEQGLMQDDVLYATEDTVVVVNIKPSDTLSVKITDPTHAIKIAYEIGNRHAPLFWGEHFDEIIMEYNAPMEKMLEKLHAHPVRGERKLLNNYALSAVTTGVGHTHGTEQGTIHHHP